MVGRRIGFQCGIKKMKTNFLFFLITIGVIMCLVFRVVTFCSELDIRTLEREEAQYRLETAKKDYQLVQMQIENEKLRFKVFDTLTN